jgi:S1-C subfamily serine protease
MSIRFMTPVALCVLLVGVAPTRAEDTGFIGVQLKAPDEGKGLVIVALVSDGPAEKAGVKVDDVIAEMDGKAVTDLKAFVEAVRGHKPGDTITLKVLRDGKGQDIKVKVGKPPADKEK